MCDAMTALIEAQMSAQAQRLVHEQYVQAGWTAQAEHCRRVLEASERWIDQALKAFPDRCDAHGQRVVP